MIETRTGNTLTCQSPQAAELYRQAVDLILGSESGAADMLDKALELDPDFALAAAARYYVAQDTGEQDAEAYQQRAERGALHAGDSEREHIAVLLGLINQPGATRERALGYINTTPKDLLVVSKLAGNMFFFDGAEKLQNVLKVFESVEPALADDWALLARLGFAAGEAGQHQRGRALLERAFALRPQSLYTIHGLAHLLHDEGAAEESATLLEDWLKRYGSGAREGQMYGHVQWHLALAEWQLGEHDKAFARYQTYCAPASTTCGPVLTLADCGGFLLRDYLQSGETRPLPNDVLAHIDRVWGMMGHPFIALHVAALYASAGDLDGLKRCEKLINTLPHGTHREVSKALVSSLSEFVKGDYSNAAQTLASLSPGERIGIGGSNVERILVDLLESSCKAHA